MSHKESSCFFLVVSNFLRQLEYSSLFSWISFFYSFGVNGLRIRWISLALGTLFFSFLALIWCLHWCSLTNNHTMQSLTLYRNTWLMLSWMKEEILFTTWLVTSLLVLNKSILYHLYIWIFYTTFIQRFHLFDMLLKTKIQFIELELHRFLDIFRNIQKWCIHPQSLIVKYTMDTVTNTTQYHSYYTFGRMSFS